MAFSQFLSILRARWWLGVLVLSVTVTLTVVISLLLPSQYTASASVVLDAKPDPLSAIVYAGGVSPAYMSTQLDIIQSTRVAQRVVRNLKLADNPQVREQWIEDTEGKGSIERWLAGTLQKSMEVKPSRDSNVINISYQARDPQFAAGIANAFVQAYIDTALELRVDPAKQYSNFFDSRTNDARDSLEKAQAKLSAFQREKGIIANDERFDVENARLNELSSQLVVLQALAADSTSRAAQAQGASSDRTQEVLNNPLISSLRGDLSRAEARLEELNARYGDNHPQVNEAKASIRELRSRVDAEVRRVSGGAGVTSTINRQREAQTRLELEVQRAKILRMKGVRDEGAVLVRDVESAQRSYDLLQTRLNQTTLESQATQSNVNMLTQAEAPSAPSSPRVLLNTALSIVLGLLLAAGSVLAVEMMDRRVRTPADVPLALGLPLLGIMPTPSRSRMLGGRRVPMMQQRLLVQSATAGKAA